MLLIHDKPFHTLDNYLDIERFLSLKDEFYYMFCSNLEYSKASWNAAGIDIDSDWVYLMKHPFLYHALHKHKDDPYITLFQRNNNREGLCKYLQLKYNCFNPYTFMHLGEKNKGFHSFVPGMIQQWAYSLPFERLDLVSVLYNEHYVPLKYHRDFNFFPYEEGDNREVPIELQDVIWLRFDLSRDLFLYDFDEEGNELDRVRFEGYSVNFNHYNWHGSIEANDVSTMTVKVEGKFKQEFKDKIYA
jgi:hypothetical protein